MGNSQPDGDSSAHTKSEEDHPAEYRRQPIVFVFLH